MSDLIDPTSGEWDEPLIRDNFWSLDVECILQIPLSQQKFEDNVAWHYTKTGVFSVRSAYYCEWDDQYGSKLGQEGGQSSSMNHPVWKQVWKLKMPGKVKIFIWRCLHNAIPFRSTLANRHIPVSGECPVCHAGAEDSKHALFGCKRARSVWLELGLLDEINKATPTDREGAKVIEFLLCDDKFRRNYMDIVDIPEVIASTCWYLWWQRREMAKGEQVQNPFRTSMAIRALSLNYVRAVSKPNPVDRQKTWKRVQTGMQILNVDAAFTAEDHTGACGMVVRDHDGGFIAAATTQMTHVADVISAEAEAMRQGIMFIRGLGCDKIMIQSDSLIVTDALKLNEGYTLVAAPILDDCRSLLQDFGKVTIEHCFRETNMVAHFLASYGRSNPSTVWLDTPPSFILNALANDVSFI